MQATPSQFFLAVAFCAVASAVHATGDYSPPEWLAQGGAAVEKAPEFYWAVEVRKIAIPFKPTQVRKASPSTPGDAAEPESLAVQAARADLEDFQEALKKGLVKGADAEAKHKAARDTIANANETTDITLPDEVSSEFRDYHRGAFAFHLGEKHYDEAGQIWEALLKRPAEERHYRSVWAAFMLGKLAVYGQQPEAVKWFRLTRQLAKEGYADSLGLAADSYGWEAKSELDQDHLEKAAQLYLTQLALGDESAIASLKSLVADRQSSFDASGDAAPATPSTDPAVVKKLQAEKEAATLERLVRSARDPLLRRITSAHVLATETSGWQYQSEGGGNGNQRCDRWLAAIEKAGVENVEDADLLGWVAYTAGKYNIAERWLKVCKGDTSAALWLKSKLLRRAGKTKEALEAMAASWKIVREEKAAQVTTPDERYTMWFEGLDPMQLASGELGSLHLTRGDFVSALDVFVSGNMLFDAAFIAERVLTADELKSYIDAHFPPGTGTEGKDDLEYSRVYGFPAQKGYTMRWLLGRRLVREDRYDEARGYLPQNLRPVLDSYVAALNEAGNEKLPKVKRARAWFNAATIARYSGMELMGTEGAPDYSISGGSFEFDDIAGERETGTLSEYDYSGDKPIRKSKPIKLAVPVSAEEKKRLATNHTSPNKRFHYRYIAAALGWKAAALLPDQSPELADVLNASGGWISKDDEAADKFFQAIERRASKTALGRAAGAKHWFVENKDGPWSKPPAER